MGQMVEVLFWGLMLVWAVISASRGLTKELRDRNDRQSRRRTKAVVVLTVAAVSMLGVALVFSSRPDRFYLAVTPLFAFHVLIRAVVLTARWGITNKPALVERIIQDLTRRPIGG